MKRKRPTRLHIPVGIAAPISAKAVNTETPGVVEKESDEYSVYCKRGKREAMEDRFSAITNLHGDPKQVIIIYLLSLN